MSELWLTGDETLISLGFAGNSGMIIYLPLDTFPVLAERLVEDYHAKVIIKRIATNQIFAIDIPIVKRDGKPWGKWRITKRVTAQSGLISFQFRAINEYYRLLNGKLYRGIVFDAVEETQ